MTDKLVPGEQCAADDSRRVPTRFDAQGVEDTGRDGGPPAPNPKRIVSWRRCNVCRDRKTCALDVFGNWNCADCEECFDA